MAIAVRTSTNIPFLRYNMKSLTDSLPAEQPQQDTYDVWLVSPEENQPLTRQRNQGRVQPPEHRKLRTRGYLHRSSVFIKSMLKSLIHCIMRLTRYPSIFICIIILFSTMTTVKPKHAGADKDWKYINRIELQAVHTNREQDFKPNFERRGFAIKKALLQGLYVDTDKEDELKLTAIDELKEMISLVILADFSIVESSAHSHVRILVNNYIVLMYSDRVTKNIKMRNPEALGALFDTAQNVTDRVVIYLDLAMLWFDKTEQFYDICKWEQITVLQPAVWQYRPGKDPNKNNPQTAINSLTTQVSNFVRGSTKAGGTTATTFDFSVLPASSKKKYHDHLNIEKLFTEAEMAQKLEDPNNSGHYTLL